VGGFERGGAAHCSCFSGFKTEDGNSNAGKKNNYNVLLERGQKPPTAGALAERGVGGRKKVSLFRRSDFFLVAMGCL
jgi:hypothetical protein